jgi:hypothetical protein
VVSEINLTTLRSRRAKRFDLPQDGWIGDSVGGQHERLGQDDRKGPGCSETSSSSSNEVALAPRISINEADDGKFPAAGESFGVMQVGSMQDTGRAAEELVAYLVHRQVSA